MAKIEMALEGRLAAEQIPGRAVSRIKSAWSIYTKMRNEHKTFAQLMDVYEAYLSAAERALEDAMDAGIYSDGSANGGKQITGLATAVPSA